MRRILVTGMSGTGKSSVLAELRKLGFRAVDTDEGDLTEWSEADDGYVWREERMAELLGGEEGGPALYVSGTVSNQGRFYERFDAVVLLSAPAEVLLSRIESRTSNPYGKSRMERELVLRHLEEVEPLLRRTCTHEVDARQPLAPVVEQLAALADEPRAESEQANSRAASAGEGSDVVMSPEVVIKQTEPLRGAESRGVAAGLSPEHIGPVFLELSPRLLGHLQRAGAQPGTLVHYYEEPADDGSVGVHVAYEIADQTVPPTAEIRITELPVIEVAAVVHRGGMDTITGVYEALLRWIEDRGLQLAGYSRELYHEMGADGPRVTEIQLPIRRPSDGAEQPS